MFSMRTAASSPGTAPCPGTAPSRASSVAPASTHVGRTGLSSGSLVDDDRTIKSATLSAAPPAGAAKPSGRLDAEPSVARRNLENLPRHPQVTAEATERCG